MSPPPPQGPTGPIGPTTTSNHIGLTGPTGSFGPAAPFIPGLSGMMGPTGQFDWDAPFEAVVFAIFGEPDEIVAPDKMVFNHNGTQIWVNRKFRNWYEIKRHIGGGTKKLIKIYRGIENYDEAAAFAKECLKDFENGRRTRQQAHICAHCHLDPPDGSEQPSTYNDAWLHPRCEKAFIRARMADQGIPWRGEAPPAEKEPPPQPSSNIGASNLKFQHATALEFFKAVRPGVCISGYTLGRKTTTVEQFQTLTREADDKHEHLFFHVATVKSTWTSGTTATKDQIQECNFLWGDCDAKKYTGNDPTEAAKHYADEGLRISQAIDEGLTRLGIQPYAKWRSGAGWQFLVKLDQPIPPDEAEILVGKLHIALGFDPVVRNCNRILRIPGSINWKDGKDGRVPSQCLPLYLRDIVTSIDDIRNALANVTIPEPKAKTGGTTQTTINWSKVKQPGWLSSAADLPSNVPDKLRRIVEHTGTLKELNEDLIENDLLDSPYKTWSEVSLALAASLKFYGKYTTEEIAEALLADLHCNQHIAKQKDQLRAVERAIVRSYDPPNEEEFEKELSEAELQEQQEQLQRVELRTTTNPIAALMKLRDAGAKPVTLMAALNQNFAVVKRGSKVRIACITGKDIDFMMFDDFHNMLGNLLFKKAIVISKRWLKWKNRRQYVGRGVVFEPGGPLEIPGDMLNLWRGFGVEPKQGDWSLMYNHIREVICSGNEEHFQYLIKLLAYKVQHLDRPIGVEVAIRGEEGAGKGFFWRNFGKLFGRHFKHITHSEQITGRFNAVLGDACFVFLDEALWAADRKGDNILRSLITEDTFQLELKFFDPITVENRIGIGIAGNSQWVVSISHRGRRNLVLDASDQYADENDPAHVAYWGPLYAEFGDYAPDDGKDGKGGRAAMLYDLLHMDLRGFNIRAVPKTTAKIEQKLLSQTGTAAWLFEILQEGAIQADNVKRYSPNICEYWKANGMKIVRDDAYQSYLQFSQEQREYKPRSKEWWSRDLRKILGGCVSDERPWAKGSDRRRYLIFHSLEQCRKAYGEYLEADNIEWNRV
jgi:hypothetical protein